VKKVRGNLATKKYSTWKGKGGERGEKDEHAYHTSNTKTTPTNDAAFTGGRPTGGPHIMTKVADY